MIYNNNKMADLFEFRLAKIGELPYIMEFIEKFWKKDHILGRDREFFVYEHGNENGLINFFIAVERMTGEIRSIQGFIPYSQSNQKLHICGVITQVHPENKVPMLGIETMKQMLNYLKPVTYCGIGTNPVTMLPLVKKFLKRHVGIMDHYYRLNDCFKSYKIASVNNIHNLQEIKTENTKSLLTFKLIERYDDIEFYLSSRKLENYFPYKSKEYIRKRYFDHPIYSYQVYEVCIDSKSCTALIIMREVVKSNRKALLWVDYIGQKNSIPKLIRFFDVILSSSEYEFIDCLCTGLEDDVFKKLGFLKKDHNGPEIIPSYYEPFMRKNIKIHYEKSMQHLILFKGDADADRPNIRQR